MWPGRVANPKPLALEPDAPSTALRGLAPLVKQSSSLITPLSSGEFD